MGHHVLLLAAAAWPRYRLTNCVLPVGATPGSGTIIKGFPPRSHLQCVVPVVPNDLYWASSWNELPSQGCCDSAHPVAVL